MRKTLLITLILVAFQSSAQWINVYQDSTCIEVNDLHFFNKDTGLVCGQIYHGVGFIQRTYDGGISWQNTISTIPVCMAIDFINDTLGFAGGQDGYIYQTNDKGITWTWLSTVAFTQDFEDLLFINDSIGFVKNYNGSLYKTIDCGQTWQYIAGFSCPSYFYDRKNHSIYFLNDSIGFVVGTGIYKTTDQGDNWHKQNADSTKYFRAIHMINNLEGFAVGNLGTLAHTTDGGQNWSNSIISDQDLRDIYFVSDSIGFIAGGGRNYNNDTVGIILSTIDKGNTWQTIIISDSRINSLQFMNSVAYATGNYGNIFTNLNYFSVTNIEQDFPTHKVGLKIWPNPASNEFHFSIKERLVDELILTDLSGKVILSKRKFSENKISIKDVSLGLYFVRIKSGNNFYFGKVLIH